MSVQYSGPVSRQSSGTSYQSINPVSRQHSSRNSPDVCLSPNVTSKSRRQVSLSSFVQGHSNSQNEETPLLQSKTPHAWCISLSEQRWKLQTRLARKPGLTVFLAVVAATLVYAASYFLRYPMLVPVDVCKAALVKEKCAVELACQWDKHRNICRHGKNKHADFYGSLWNHRGKIWITLGHASGYALGKLFAVPIIPSVHPQRRLYVVLGVLLFSVLAMSPFAAVRLEVQMGLVFAAAVPMSLLFGVMTQYLEGRSSTDLLNSGLVFVMVLGAPLVRSISQVALDGGLDPLELPVVILGAYTPIALLAAIVLDTVPPPSLNDALERSERVPVSLGKSLHLWKPHMLGVFLVLIGSTAITTFRSVREYFAAEIYQRALGKNPKAWEYIVMELPGAGTTILLCAILFKVKSHKIALWVMFIVMLLASALISVTSYLFSVQYISGFLYLILISLGTNLVYAPGSFLVFDRLIAALKQPGTSSFLVFLSDVLGQLGSVAAICYREFDPTQTNKEELDFFMNITQTLAGIMIGSFCLTTLYFMCTLHRSAKKQVRPTETPQPYTEQCTQCAERFSNTIALRIHMRDVHLAVPAWDGLPTQVKFSIMKLASDERNFTRKISGAVSLHAYDHALYKEMVRVTLGQQPELKTMYEKCVPGKMTDAVFWWNYFTRVRQIKDRFNCRPNPKFKFHCDFESDEAYKQYMRETLGKCGQGTLVLSRTRVLPDVYEGDRGTFYCEDDIFPETTCKIHVHRLNGFRLLEWQDIELLEI
eukprot:m.86746 g.86746  ORF g.86746 m.86746 type:complete len:764 (-) comp13070_c1_seq2:518-2809(-)